MKSRDKTSNKNHTANKTISQNKKVSVFNFTMIRGSEQCPRLWHPTKYNPSVGFYINKNM